MSSTARVVLIVLAIAAVVVGLVLGRSCRKVTDDFVDTGTGASSNAALAPAIADAGHAALVVDAGEAQASTFVDAGDTSAMLAIAPLPPENGRVRGQRERGARDRKGGRGVRDNGDDASTNVDEPKSQPKIVDAGVVLAKVEPVVVDAGQPNASAIVDAGAPRVARAELKPEAMPSASVSVSYKDELSQWLKLVELRVFVDGKRVVDEKSDKGIALTTERVLHEAKVFPGHHQVRVEAKYAGHSAVFSYLEGYTFRMREMTVVEVDEKRGARVSAVAYDKGAMNAWERRWGLKLTTK